jgi:hypothetical protein
MTFRKADESRVCSGIFFLIGIVGDGVQLGPLVTAATNRPIVPAPGDYDDGEIGGMIPRGNRSTRRKPAPVPLCPPQTPHALPGRELGPPVLVKLDSFFKPALLRSKTSTTSESSIDE